MDITSFLLGYKSGAAKGGGSGGSGGGSLPAGMYLSASPIPNPTIYRHKRFMLNGELYASCYPGTGAGYLRTIYKWDGSAWFSLLTTSSTTTDVIGGGMDATGWTCAEYNGKLHMIEKNIHYVFDGATLVKTTNVPQEANSICVCNGKLYACFNSYKTSCLYEWDDDNSAWNTVETFSSVSYSGNVRSYGDQLYFIEATTVYKYVDGALISWGTAPVSTSAYFYAGDELYCYKIYTYYTVWYKVNLETMEYSELGQHPSLFQIYPTLNADELSFTGCTYTTNSKFPFYVVTIVKETE